MSFDFTEFSFSNSNSPDTYYNFYDYVLDINTSYANWNNINIFFNERTYIENNISININLDSLNNLLYTTNSTFIKSAKQSITSKYAYTTLEPNAKLIGLRFLEIIATKIFGHAKARSAINNDTDFYLPYSNNNSVIKKVIDGIDMAVNSKKTDIFNTYNTLNRQIENNYFNFENTQWMFPVYFTFESQTTLNGPNVGGNIFTNGKSNVSLLLRFK